MDDDTGLHIAPKVLRVLREGEVLDYALHGHEVYPTWGNRVAEPNFVLVTNQRLLVVTTSFLSKPTVHLSIDWQDGLGVTGETDGGWIRIDLQTTRGTLSICNLATKAYELEVRSRDHIIRARDGVA